jgi:hypothetical protein
LARAKHTDRTEARRRHRAEQATLVSAEETGEPTPNVLSRDATKAPPAPPERPGLVNSFRGAFRPVDLRADLRVLPQVVTHWAVLVSSAIAIVATAAFITSTNEIAATLDFSLSDPLAGKEIGSVSNISYLVISLFVAPPPAAGAFLVGFTARRASWLGGLAYGIVAAVCYGAILASPAGRLLIGNNPVDVYLLNAVAMGPVGALLFASAAAWYKRFLNMANPNRGRRPTKPQPKQRARAAAAKAGSRSR